MAARDARISIAVYRVDPATGRRRTVRWKREYSGDDSELHVLTTPWPPCRCHRCVGAAAPGMAGRAMAAIPDTAKRPPLDSRVMASAVLALTALTIAAWLHLC